MFGEYKATIYLNSQRRTRTVGKEVKLVERGKKSTLFSFLGATTKMLINKLQKEYTWIYMYVKLPFQHQKDCFFQSPHFFSKSLLSRTYSSDSIESTMWSSNFTVKIL